MKKYNNIDDFFKEQVSDFQIEPSSKVWQNIESKVLKTKKSNTRKTILLAAASLILIVGSVFIGLIFTDNNYQNNKPIATNNIINIKPSNKITIIDEIVTTHETNTSNIAHAAVLSADSDVISANNSKNNNISSANNNQINSGNHSNYITPDKKTAFNFNSFNKDRDTDSFNINNGIKSITPKDNYVIDNVCKPSIINDFQKITVDSYIKKRKNMHIYTGASASIAMTYYSASTDQITWSADLTYGLKLKKYYIESGIGFQQMEEEGIFKIDYKTNDSVGYYNKVVSFEVNPNDPNTITYKTQTTTVYDSIHHHLLQSPLYKYNYVTIPIKFGYNFFQKEQLSVSVETGIIYSYLTKTFVPTVKYSNQESQLLGITNNTPQRVEHNFRLHIALRINYNITKTISVYTQPEFTKYINSIYKESNLSNTKPYTMGIRFGILFDF